MSSKQSTAKTRIYSNFTPVQEIDGNLKTGHQAGTAQKVRDSVLQLNTLSQEWNKLHTSGSAILSSIASMKVDALAKQDSELNRIYPDGLQEKCSELDNVTSKLENIVKSMQLLTEQLRAVTELNSLQCGDSSPLFVTWPTEKFHQVFSKLLEAYSSELSVKLTTKEEVAHTSTKEAVLLHLSCWLSQPFITSNVSLLLVSLLSESSLNK